MKTRIILLAILVLGVVGTVAYGSYWFGMNQGMKSRSTNQPAGDDAEKKPLYWHDPMVPTQKFDKPGKSPFMDMQLVAVYGGDAGDEGTVSISPRVQQNLGIRTADVTLGEMSHALVAVGSVAYNERDVALVQARSNGFVERLYVRAPLDAVRKGQALVELLVPDWIAAQEEYLSVKRMQSGLQGNSLETLVDAARQRMRLVGMTDEQIRLIEANGKVISRVTITAPVSGVVAELSVREGMTVMSGAALFRINGLSSVWVNAEVPENLAAQLQPGVVVEARSAAHSGVVFKGRVSAILPEINAVTRTLKARIELANPSGQLLPGMFVTVNFAPSVRKNVVLIPSEAVIQTGKRSVVMVTNGEGKFLPVDVELGAEANGQTEIRKGLEAGQKVVISGQFLIDSEASLKTTTTRMSDTPMGEAK